MSIPQIIWIGLIGLNLGVALVKHGEPRNEEYNFWVTLISSAITVLLLIWAGVF